ncbi:hypothetical protein [Maribacter sp. 2-571]|uniref:hypothetical protein n=1 Tax=Maribacter sp. 2-571 TaxID=3417569 RepID=UPI003D330656
MDIIIGMISGVLITIGISFAYSNSLRKSDTGNEPVQANPAQPNVEEKISPFVEIHMEHMNQVVHTGTEESINRLKQKIERFKQRNRFYGEPKSEQ